MVNVKIIPAIAILTVISLMLFIVFVVESGEPNDDSVKKIYADPSAEWRFQGTYCTGCNYLYNYDEYPEVCTKCGKQTKDYFHLVLIKDRN